MTYPPSTAARGSDGLVVISMILGIAAGAGCAGAHHAHGGSDGGPGGAAGETPERDGGALPGTSATGTTSSSGDGEGGGAHGGGAADAGAHDSGPADPCAPVGGLPMDLSCTGLYTDITKHTVAAANVTYTPAYPLWSDGAEKSRWLSLPAGAKIDNTKMGAWVFPTGTRAWKEFRVGGKRVETRFIQKNGPGDWQLGTYRWNAAETAATRLDAGEANVGGTTYAVPSRSDCDECHGGRVEELIGIDAVELGGAAAAGATVSWLSTQGKLKVPVAAADLARLKIPEDATGKAQAALGWLHVNCGATCHNQDGAGSNTGFFMNITAADLLLPGGAVAKVTDLATWKTGIATAPWLQQYASYKRIAPGSPTTSLAVLFAETRDTAGTFEPMPPLGSNVVDATGLAAVKAWIAALPATSTP